ncbi:MAG: hypothetical protein AB7U81_02840 [Thiohalomonadaceae bacterium]
MRPVRRMMDYLRAGTRERGTPVTPASPRLPPVDLAMIGAEHADTSLLFGRLAAHPAFHTHRTEQMTYFANPGEHARGYAHAFRHHYGAARGDTVLVARCDTMLDVPASLDRLAGHNAAAHVVVMLRHPVERAWAAYWHARRTGREPLPRFEMAIAAEELGHGDRRYLGRGKYSRQLAHLFARFPARRIHVFIAEDAAADPDGACERLCSVFEAGAPVRACDQAYGAEPAGKTLYATLRRAFAHLIRRGGSPPLIPEMVGPLRRRLVAYFEPYNQELEHMLGRNLHAWRR